MRFAVDTGGTFTDLVVEDDAGDLHMFKAATTPEDPINGVIDSLQAAADAFGTPLKELLGRGEMLIHGTTHAINAIITGNTARTAFLTSQGHPDVLVLREGGRTEPFNYTVPYPEPYIPRSLTWEVPGRLLADGNVFEPLDEDAVRAILAEMKKAKVEAVAVCLLWSIVNPLHEKRVGELIAEAMPGIPYTLSHQLNPSLREYRRASSAALDASLKPLMGTYMRNLTGRLKEAGFRGRALVVTSQAGVIDADHAAEAPIHLINSGPSMAPVAGRYFAQVDEQATTAVIADTGGTTYDVSLVRKGSIPWTRETWIGTPHRGHMTGFPSVDVKSIGAGGGSIAWVDHGGMLHVGPQSAGAQPGPVCYGKGGDLPTLTDASIILGYIDPGFFLGGSMRLDVDAARAAIERDVAKPLNMSVEQAAAAIVEVATENMVQAIMDITVAQGIDPAEGTLIGGGGAAGLNSVLIARRLGCPSLVIPEVGAGLSAAGALMSDLSNQFAKAKFAHTGDFDRDGVNAVLADLAAQAQAFIDGPGKGSVEQKVTFIAEARYPHQVWEIEVPLRSNRFDSEADVRTLVQDFHDKHDEIFAISDPGAEVEVIGWTAVVRCRIRRQEGGSLKHDSAAVVEPDTHDREMYFPDAGKVKAQVRRFDDLKPGERISGPAVIESSFTTVVINPGASAVRRPSGSLSINPFG